MVFCVLDTYDGRLHLGLAGHPPPLLIRGGKTVALPDVGGFPIALAEGAEYDDGIIQLTAGDRLCLCSDGIIEQTDAAKQDQFG